MTNKCLLLTDKSSGKQEGTEQGYKGAGAVEPCFAVKATTSLGEVNIFLAMFIALKCVNTWQRWTEMCGNIPNKLHCLAAINDHNGNYCKHQGQAQKA